MDKSKGAKSVSAMSQRWAKLSPEKKRAVRIGAYVGGAALLLGGIATALYFLLRKRNRHTPPVSGVQYNLRMSGAPGAPTGFFQLQDGGGVLEWHDRVAGAAMPPNATFEWDVGPAVPDSVKTALSAVRGFTIVGGGYLAAYAVPARATTVAKQYITVHATGGGFTGILPKAGTGAAPSSAYAVLLSTSGTKGYILYYPNAGNAGVFMTFPTKAQPNTVASTGGGVTTTSAVQFLPTLSA